VGEPAGVVDGWVVDGWVGVVWVVRDAVADVEYGS